MTALLELAEATPDAFAQVFPGQRGLDDETAAQREGERQRQRLARLARLPLQKYDTVTLDTAALISEIETWQEDWTLAGERDEMLTRVLAELRKLPHTFTGEFKYFTDEQGNPLEATGRLGDHTHLSLRAFCVNGARLAFPIDILTVPVACVHAV